MRQVQTVDDAFQDLRPDIELIARTTDQSPQQAALGLAHLLELERVRVDADHIVVIRRLRAFAASCCIAGMTD